MVCLDALARLVVVEERGARGQRDERTRRARPPRRRAPEALDASCWLARLLADVDDIDAAILGPRRFVVAFAARLFLAEAHRLDLDLGARPAASSASSPRRRASGRARCCTRACRARRCCPAAIARALRLACRYLACASTIGLVLVLDRELVVVEVDAALRQDVVRILERAAPDAAARGVPVTPRRPDAGRGRARRAGAAPVPWRSRPCRRSGAASCVSVLAQPASAANDERCDDPFAHELSPRLRCGVTAAADPRRARARRRRARRAAA